MLLNCGAGEDAWDWKEIQPVHPKGNQSWISLEGLMLKLKLQYLHHLSEELTHLKRPWFWGRLKAGERDNRGWEAAWHHQLNGHEFEEAPELVMGREAWHAAIHGVAKSRTRLSDWTELTDTFPWWFLSAHCCSLVSSHHLFIWKQEPACWSALGSFLLPLSMQ